MLVFLGEVGVGVSTSAGAAMAPAARKRTARLNFIVNECESRVKKSSRNDGMSLN